MSQNGYEVFVCVCACVYAYVCACVAVCVGALLCLHDRMIASIRA